MLELFHDFTHPASAVAVARCQRLADEGLAVAFVGFEAIGVEVAVPPTLDVLAARDAVEAAATEEGLVLRKPQLLPPTALAHVVSDAADRAGLGAAWRQACYQAFWEDGADLADPQALVDLAAGVGLDPEAARNAVGDRTRLAAFRRGVAAHRSQGVGGVPTIRAQQTLVPGLMPEDDLRALARLA